MNERQRHGPYRSLVDFLRRTPARLLRPAVENLIWVGGMDTFGLTRRELLWQTGLWLGPEEERTRAEGRADDPQLPFLFRDPDADLAFPNLDGETRMVAEYRMLHFSTELHPFALVRNQIPPGTISSGQLADRPTGSIVTVTGIVIARQRPQTARGHVFVLLEDEHGHINVIVNPSVYEACRAAVRMEPFLKVRGRLQRDGSSLNLVALELESLEVRAPGGDPPSETQAPEAGRSPRDPFVYLTELRQHPPGVKSFG